MTVDIIHSETEGNIKDGLCAGYTCVLIESFRLLILGGGGGGIRGETCVDLLDYFSWGKKCISLAIYIQKIAIASVLLRNKYVFLPTRRTLKSN